MPTKISSSDRSTEEGDCPKAESASAPEIQEARVAFHDSDFEAIGIADLVGLLREAKIGSVETLDCRDDGAVLEVETERAFGASRLSSVDSIDDWSRIQNSGDGFRYILEVTAPKFPPSVAGRTDDLIGPCDPDLYEHRMTMSLVGPREAIADIVGRFQTAGLSPDLHRIGPYDPHDRPMDRLTERQREALVTAYEMGYYDVPRTALMEDIASELGVEASTVNEHLQRAERNLLAQHLSTGP